MSITVVVNTYNSEDFIEKCLQSLKKQTLKPDEILVVDHTSKDKTVALAEKFNARVVVVEGGKRGHVRNIGWKKARSDYILYADSDDILNEVWVEKIMQKFDEGADAVIDRIKVYNPKNFFQKSSDALYDFRMRNYKPFSAWAFKKKVLEEIGGFKDLWIEEIDLGKRLQKKGYKILLAKDAIRYHVGKPHTFKDMISRNLNSGYNEYKDVFKSHPESFPVFNIILFFKIYFSFLILFYLGFFYPVVWSAIPLIPIGLFGFLLFKFAFLQKALGKMPLKYVFGITINSTIRAIFWPLGIIKGMLF